MPGLPRDGAFAFRRIKLQIFRHQGLGPINAISPFNTLSSCGNSSNDVERTIFPHFVSLTSSGNGSPFRQTHPSLFKLDHLEYLSILTGSGLNKECSSPFVGKMKPNGHSQQYGAKRQIRATKLIIKSNGRLKSAYTYLYFFSAFNNLPSITYHNARLNNYRRIAGYYGVGGGHF